MTWTVETKSTVSSSGDVPARVRGEYSCTYQKGTVRSGDKARLSLTGMNGVTIESVDVYMRSNKSAGAGVLSAYADGSVLEQKNGTFKDWVGQFDNTAFHPINLYTGTQVVQDSLVVELIGTTNSLYIEKFVVTYQSAPIYTLTLMDGQDVCEELEKNGGVGILLPTLPNKPNWEFVGWSPTQFWTITTLPEIFYPHTHVFLTEDLVLWSVWRYVPQNKENTYVTELKTGDYIYLNTESDMAITGTVVKGEMDRTKVNQYDKNQIYHIVFNTTCTSATIQHVQTGKYIGYSGTRLLEAPTPWLVWHAGDKTAFYTIFEEKTYILWHNILAENGEYAGLQLTKDVSYTPTALLSINNESSENVFTCHPESDMGTENIQLDSKGIVVPFGIYEIHIRQGKKYLRLRY